MNGTAAIYGYLVTPGKVVFATIIDVKGQRHSRVVPVNLKSAYAAELAGVEYAMKAVNRRDEVDLVMKVHSKNLPGIFSKNDKGDWKKTYKTNHEIIDQIRALSEEFKSFKCETDRHDDFILKAKAAAKQSRDLVLAHSESE